MIRRLIAAAPSLLASQRLVAPGIPSCHVPWPRFKLMVSSHDIHAHRARVPSVGSYVVSLGSLLHMPFTLHG